jgi:hypothetical protein
MQAPPCAPYHPCRAPHTVCFHHRADTRRCALRIMTNIHAQEARAASELMLREFIEAHAAAVAAAKEANEAGKRPYAWEAAEGEALDRCVCGWVCGRVNQSAPATKYMSEYMSDT